MLLIRHLRVRAVVVLVAALTGLVAAPPTAHADTVAQPPSPGVIGPYPAPGQVVAAGSAEIAAFLVAQDGVQDAELYLDGTRLSAGRSGDPTYQRLAATSHVAPGDHTVEVRLRDGQGRTAARGWRFSASSMVVARLAGQDRIATAVAISRDLFPAAAGAKGAVLARADDFPDALAGAPLAAAAGGPLLLTPSGGLSPDTARELRRVLAGGASVYLLGGPAALSEQVAADVRGLGFTAQRVAGVDRYGTAVATAQRSPASTAAFVASGQTFPDALAASSPAALHGHPILLATRDALPPATREHLRSRSYRKVFVVGGGAVVDDPVVAEIDGLAGEVVRLAGDGRYTTAAAVAQTFFPETRTVTVASGDRFPDALAGGPHAAVRGAPMLLSPAGGLARPQVDQLAAWRPETTYLYGGPAALSHALVGAVRGAALDAGAPRETELAPAPGSEINALDTLQLTFDRALRLDLSTVFVTLGGHEVFGTLAQGDFPNTIVFRAGALPIATAARHPYPVRVVATAFDGSRVRHLEYELTFRKLDLSRGDSGAEIRAVQDRLVQLGYWLGQPDGTFGSLMTQAVYAFQKVEGLSRTGSIDPATRERLQVAARPVPRNVHAGRYVEVDKTRQVLLVVQDGAVLHAFNTSTGTGEFYNENGHSGYAITPEGSFTFFRQIDGMRQSDLGQLWRPKYFTDRGHAIHGSNSVPPYPASHGCVRLSNGAIDFIWQTDLVSLGTRLYVYS
ncbi:MAG TPA: cell wall-binding repeat-containing protein [Nitriliruptorales bacterium]|nr:cell wall-binding repeat-containing protein [Nitriliruptorales bacterium]